MSALRPEGVRKAAAGLLAAASVIALSVTAAQAQQSKAPSGPIEIVVGSSAGSTPDVLMRRAAQIWNQSGIITNPIVVQNRTGAAWANAFRYVLEKPNDDKIVVSLAEPIWSTPIVQGTELLYNKFVPLGIWVQTQLIVIAQPGHKANTLAEMAALAKASPKQIKMSGSTPGTTDEQVLGLIKAATGTDITYIPHDGGGAAMTTFLGGNTDMITATIDEALPQIKAGKAKPLAILNDQRRPEAELKGIPTAKEQGVNVTWGQYFGLAGAPGLDPAVAKWWDEKITALTQNDAWKKAIQENFQGSTHTRGEELKTLMKNVHDSRVQILRQLGASKI